MAQERMTAKEYRQGALFNRADHSNLGKDLEKDLEKTHYNYKHRGIADVVKNAEKWNYTGLSAYNDNYRSTHDIVAKTNSGRYLIKCASDIDFSGNLSDGRAVYFDSKQTRGKSLPLGNIKGHQIRRLADKEASGAIAGLLVYFSDLDRLFFISGSIIEEFQIKALYKKGRKSIPLAAFEDVGREIFRTNNLWDWAKVF